MAFNIDDLKDNVDVKKEVGWLLPGLEVKRWFLLIFFGSVMIVLGFMVLANVRPIYLTLELIRKAALVLPSNLLAAIFILIGSVIFFKGWQKTTLSIMDMNSEKGNSSILEKLYRRRKLNRGAKVVAIGGGTGLSMLLRGVKRYTSNVTAIVTVGDDGGSSGRLRNEMGILPPGDIRNCIAALGDDEDLITELFQYRFKTGEGLEGHSFGNLFLTALCSITGNMVKAIKESANVLNIRGVVLPATLDDMKLGAEFEDGRIVHGESSIPEAHGQIKRLFTEPENCQALPEAIDAIGDADLIILGPGSLYTSVIPNLLVNGIVEAILKSKAKKIYVCNIMTQPGETTDYTVASHVNALFKHAKGNKIVDAVLVNNRLPDNISEGYAKQGSIPVVQKEYEKIVMEVFVQKCTSLEDTKKLAYKFVSLVKEQGCFVNLFGEIGAGKTAFVKFAAEALGIKEKVTSPSFVILNEYHSASIPVYHFDLYRLEHTGISTITDELREYSEGKKITFVEWAEFSQGELPFERIEINVTYDDDDSRVYEFKSVGNKNKYVIEGLKA